VSIVLQVRPAARLASGYELQENPKGIDPWDVVGSQVLSIFLSGESISGAPEGRIEGVVDSRDRKSDGTEAMLRVVNAK
jgi:hypothetical protein